MSHLPTNKTLLSLSALPEEIVFFLSYVICPYHSRLDVDDGRVARGNLKLRDAGDPVQVAQAYEQQGADELVFLDITASSDERETMRDVVERTVATCFMPVTVGGGIRKLEDIRSMLLAGADKVSMNTAAILNPDLIDDATSTFGNQCIVVAIDAKCRKMEMVG